MRITKMAVGMGVTVNLGNYQNIKAESMVEAELESHDSVDRVEAVLNERARWAVANQLADYVLEVASEWLEQCDDEADVKRLLGRSAAYEFLRHIEPEVGDNTLRLLTLEWQQAQPLVMDEITQPADVTGASSEPVTIADLELQAEATSAQLDALLDELDAEPDLTNLPPDSEYLGEYPDEDYPDNDELDEDDFDDADDDQPEFDTEPDFDDDDDEYDADNETPSPDEIEYVDEVTEPDTEVEV